MKMERLAWLLILSATLAWGLSRHGSSSAEASSGAPVEEKRMPGKIAGSAGPAQERQARPERGHASRGGVEARTVQALKVADPLARMSQFLEVLGDCDSASIRESMIGWQKFKAGGTSLPAEEALLNFRSGQLAGGRFLESRTGSSADMADILSVRGQFEGWLAADAGAARAWLESLPAGRYRNELTIASIAATTRDDPAAALHEMGTLPESLQASAAALVAQHLSQTESAENSSEIVREMASASGGENPPYLKDLFSTLLRNTTDVDQAAALVEQHLDESYVPIYSIGRVGVEKSRRDPAAALDWAMDLTARSSRYSSGGIFEETVQDLTLENVAKAEQWETAHADAPGIDALRTALERRRRTLENAGENDP